MTSDPLVTVVIPTWNRKALVREAVDSVRGQTYRHWELIVVDDGSRDGTGEALSALAEPRLRILTLEHSGNYARGRNIGARSGSGDLVAFLDSDDLWLPHKLEIQVEAMRRSGTRWCFANYTHIDADRRPIPERAPAFQGGTGAFLRAILEERTAAFVGTLLIERGLFEDVGGFDEELFYADVDLALRLAAAADAVAEPAVVAQVRIHGGRITAKADHGHEAAAIVYEKFLARERDPGLRRIARSQRSQALVNGAGHHLRRGDMKGAARLAFAAMAVMASAWS